MEIYNTNPDIDEMASKNVPQHILMIRTDILNRYSDLHFIQTALAFKKYGHRVTIITCTRNPEYFQKKLTNFAVVKTVTWIPRSIFGYFKYFMYAIRSLAATLSYVFCPLTPEPSVIFCNVSCVAIPIFYLSGYSVIFHLQNPYEMLQLYYPRLKYIPNINWIYKQSILLAKEVMVPDAISQKIFKKVFKKFDRKAIVTYPYVDMELMNINGTINIRTLVPKLPTNGYLFVCFGEYLARFNFQLILKAFLIALKRLNGNICHKMHLVIAATYDKTIEEHQKYYNALSNLINLNKYSQNFTLLKDINVVDKKCLMYEATAVVHTPLYDVFSPIVLEAMFLGKTIIGTNSGFARHVLVNQITGFLLPPNPEEFASLIQKLVNNKILAIYIGNLAETEYKYRHSFSEYAKTLNRLITRHSFTTCCPRHCCLHRNVYQAEDHKLCT